MSEPEEKTTADATQEPATDVLSDEESEEEDEPEEELQVEDVFKAAPGNQKVFMAVMEACRESCTPSDLDEMMDELLRDNRSVYRPTELRNFLERYNAIEYQPSEEELAARAAEETGEDPELTPDEDGYLVPHKPAEGAWVLTAAGTAYLDSDPLRTKTAALMSKDLVYTPVYVQLLDYVDEHPRTKSQIDNLIDPHPLIQNPRLYAGYFLSEMEKIDAMEWKDDAWHVTDFGREFLDELRALEVPEDATREAGRGGNDA